MSAGHTLAVVGAGGHGRVVADSAVAAGWSDVVFFDDRYPKEGSSGPWPIIGVVASVIAERGCFESVMVGIGSNEVRARLTREFADAGLPLATIIHPRAWISPNSVIGRGCLVAAGAMVNIGARIGQATILNTGATVDHDCEIGEAVHVSPGAHIAGGVKVGDLAWVGIGASVREGVSIGERSMIGAGSAVISHIGAGVTAVGCPAEARRFHA